MKTILLTGATGFIGQNVVEELNKTKSVVIILSRKKSVNKAKKLFPHCKVIGQELERIDDLLNIEKTLLDTVTDIVHIAGGYDIEMDEIDSYMSNVVLTQNLLFLTRSMKSLEFFHLVSSFSVIGKNNAVNVNFEHELGAVKNLTNYYSKGKMYIL